MRSVYANVGLKPEPTKRCLGADAVKRAIEDYRGGIQWSDEEAIEE
jgi:hypothetical protein